MAEYAPIHGIEDAQYCLEQAKSMLKRARSMWLKARESLEEAVRMGATLHTQIEELAKHGPFRPRFTSTLLSGILDAVIEGTGADMGNIQLFHPKTGQLLIYVDRGFDEPFLRFFTSVHAGQAPCSTALKRGRRVIVLDVANSPLFSGTRLTEVMLDAGVRAVQSTPLIGKSGHIWGMLSTHYRKVRQPGKKDLRLIDYFAAWAADILEAEYHAAHRRPDSASTVRNGF
ncbi:MAG: hypothetical protein DMG38_15420 [Acidobacteria bacterium]|nr:MAG: hypothetical protein DMG38_15420 [Acidobacteriota bacterium]